MPPPRSSAWPVAWVWIGLIVYASLHPFGGWHWPHGSDARAWWEMFRLPAPHSSRFDLWGNFLAYLPLGALVAIARLRDGHRRLPAGLHALAVGVLLSLLMEQLQHLLPLRAPSRIDWALNSAGTAVGAGAALLLEALGALRLWQRVREGWLVPHGATGLALLLFWPVGLLFPTPLPFAQGQGLARLADWLEETLAGSAFEGWVRLPSPEGPLPPGLELLAIALGLLAPCLVGFVMTRHVWQRLLLLLGAAAIGPAAATLSTALNFGPEHAATWIGPALRGALVLALLLGCVLALLPRRLTAALGLVALTTLLALVNQIGADPYFAATLRDWEQGRFIRFHGLAQWVGWLWPLAALGFLIARLVEAPTPPQARHGRTRT
ncbi:MAG: VanZ family protein [Burkholderiaceae bacterium]|nr:VanZ family protein [Burkholderiaceae bacterium]